MQEGMVLLGRRLPRLNSRSGLTPPGEPLDGIIERIGAVRTCGRIVRNIDRSGTEVAAVGARVRNGLVVVAALTQCAPFHVVEEECWVALGERKLPAHVKAVGVEIQLGFFGVEVYPLHPSRRCGCTPKPKHGRSSFRTSELKSPWNRRKVRTPRCS